MTTLKCLTKNLVYKNIEAQMRKKIRTIIRTSSASNLGELRGVSIPERKKILNSLLEVNVMYVPDEIDCKKPFPFCSI